MNLWSFRTHLGKTCPGEVQLETIRARGEGWEKTLVQFFNKVGDVQTQVNSATCAIQAPQLLFLTLLTVSLSFAYFEARFAFLPLALCFTLARCNWNLCIRFETSKNESLFLSGKSFPQAIPSSFSFTRCLLGAHPLHAGNPMYWLHALLQCPQLWKHVLKLPWVLGTLWDYSLSNHISFWKLSFAVFFPLINVRDILLSCSLYPSVRLISLLSYSVCIWGSSVLMSLSVTVFKELTASEKLDMERTN